MSYCPDAPLGKEFEDVGAIADVHRVAREALYAVTGVERHCWLHQASMATSSTPDAIYRPRTFEPRTPTTSFSANLNRKIRPNCPSRALPD